MIYGIFDSVNTGTAESPVYDRIFDADFLSELFAFISKENGVKGFEVTATGGMGISIAAGSGIIEGRFAFEPSTTVLEVAQSNTTRTDMVVLRCDIVNRLIKLAVVQGSTYPSRTTNIYELCLAKINVAAGATSISNADITDTRADAELCGLATSSTTTAGITISGDATGSITFDGTANKNIALTVNNSAKVGGHNVFVQSDTPSNPAAGDLWFW